MGGLREDTIRSKPNLQSKDQPAQATGDIRFHEDPQSGQIHFHDDARGLKVGIPAAEWYQGWRKIRQANNSIGTFLWTYHDVTNKTLLVIESGTEWGERQFDCKMFIRQLEHGDTFNKLEKFMPTKGM